MGSIELVFFDDLTGQVVMLGSAAFATSTGLGAAWANVPEFEGDSSFQADWRDRSGDIVDEKPVSAETCTALLGRPIGALIAEGRARLAA